MLIVLIFIHPTHACFIHGSFIHWFLPAAANHFTGSSRSLSYILSLIRVKYWKWVLLVRHTCTRKNVAVKRTLHEKMWPLLKQTWNMKHLHSMDGSGYWMCLVEDNNKFNCSPVSFGDFESFESLYFHINGISKTLCIIYRPPQISWKKSF